ncbi:phospholipid carrier-dependent glycosyltransferase [bacterium]|nr:phospholipid carrier-dependent glycosyltransferase [bacterium]
MQPLIADEPIRALGALEMEISGEPIPSMNGEAYINKPPLYNWILLGTFKLFNSHSEFIVRLPALLSLLLFGVIIYYWIRKISDDKNIAFWTAMATFISGNILFYSSLLGHIDALFSAVVFSQIMVIYHHANKSQWWKFFMYSFLLCFLGFMLKGLPALVFQFISVLTMLGVKKDFKKIISKEGLLSGFGFIVLISIFFYFMSHYVPLDTYISNLWNESSKRTAIDHSLWSSIQHIFTFPLQYIIDTAPFSLLLILFFSRSNRLMFKNNRSLMAILLLFILNIIIYWLSPDNRARYIFMLYPLLFYILFFTFYNSAENKTHSIGNIIFRILSYSFPFILGVIYIIENEHVHNNIEVYYISLALALGIAALCYFKKLSSFISITAVMLISRLLFDAFIIPSRTIYMPASEEKRQALEIAEISREEPLAMYFSNLQFNMAWYISEERMQILPIKDYDDEFSTGEFYLIPSDVITDSTEYQSYYTFVRNFGNKKFELIKFKELPPSRKKHGKNDLSSDPRPQ